MYPQYSLVMTLYKNSRLDFFLTALNSMLKQTVQPAEIIIVYDGAVANALQEKINDLRKGILIPFRVVDLDENVGPGLAAAKGIESAKHNYIARLDSDDIARPRRIEEEFKVFASHPEYVAVGSLVTEFEDDVHSPLCLVELPETPRQIIEFARRRCPCRQTTLLYKRDAILSVGNYQGLRMGEEWELYNRFILHGYKCYNIQKPLVDMRVDKAYYARRGGPVIFRQLARLKWSMLRSRQMKISDFLMSISASFVVCMIPNFLREFIYMRLLRRKLR